MIKDLEDLKVKHPWVVINGTEGPDILASKHYWQSYFSMPYAERLVQWHEEKVRDAEDRLNWLIQDMKDTSEYIAHAVWLARQEEDVGKAEELVALAKKFRQQRVTIKDISNQRRVVQWERKNLMKQKKQQD